MRVLALCSYPVEAAATRFRLAQFVEPLKSKGIDLTIKPFLDSSQFRSLYKSGDLPSKALGLASSTLKRSREVFGVRKYDLILIQREAMIFGPAFFEWLFQNLGRIPMVLDLDDATYVKYLSPSYGRLGSALKFFGKTDNLIKRATAVVCGNRFIAEYVEGLGSRAEVIPTVVDTTLFCPSERSNEIPTIGWIGTHSTFAFLEPILPVFSELAKKYKFRLKIVGAGLAPIRIEGVEVENLEWDLDRETADFRSLDIGLYPVSQLSSANQQWLLGKSGFKAIQYMAVGIPFVMSPVGVCSEMGVPGVTHFNAAGVDEWYDGLKKLLESSGLRERMGNESRSFALANFTVEVQADKLAGLLRQATSKHWGEQH